MKRIAGLILLLSVLLFQNCTTEQTSQTEAASGNGQGYDGKVFYHLAQSGQCAGGEIIDSKIEFANGAAFLTRDNCQDLPRDQWRPIQSDIQFLTPYTILYQDRLYFAWLTSVRSVDSAADGRVAAAGAVFEVTGQSYLPGREFAAQVDHAGRLTALLGHPWMDRSLTASLADGFLLITRVEAAGPAGFDGIWLSRLTPAGAVLWQRALTAAGSWGAYQYLVVSRAIELKNKNILLVGTVETSLAARKMVLITVAPNGELVASRELPVEPSYSGGLKQALTGEIFLSFVHAGTPAVMRLDDDGEVLWSKSFTGFSSIGIVPAADGRLLVTGSFYSNAGGGFVLPSHRFVLLDEAGALITTTKWLPDLTIEPMPQFSWTEGRFIAQLRQGSGAAEYAAFDGSLNFLWATSMKLPNEVEIVRTETLRDGSSMQVLQGNSNIPVSSSTSYTFRISLLRRVEVEPGCPECTPITVSVMSGAPNPAVTNGPLLSDVTGAVDSATVQAPPFEKLPEP